MAKTLNHAHYGKEIFRINDVLFGQRYPYRDDVLSNCCLHLIVGQLPNVLIKRYNIGGSKLDLRTHVTVLAPSGTNKGAIFNYVSDVCDKLEMTFKQMGSFTDSALVGTPDFKKVKNKDTGEYETIDTSTFGCLHPGKFNNIVAWSEATDVFDTKKLQYNKASLSLLQKCMNPIGTSDNIVSKSTGLGEIAYNTSCSIFLTTYKPATLTSDVIGTGCMQRQIVTIHEPSMAESFDVSKSATRNLTRPPKTIESVDLLAHRLAEINEFVGKMDDLYVPEDMIPKIEYVQESFYMQIADSNILVKSKLGEFVRRWAVNILYTTMFQHAIIRLDNKLNDEDVRYAKNFLVPIWTEFAAFLENALLNDNKELENIRLQLKHVVIAYHMIADKRKSDYILEMELVTWLSLDWAKSIRATKQIVDSIIGDVFELSTIRQHAELFDDDDETLLGEQRVLKLKPGVIKLIIK